MTPEQLQALIAALTQGQQAQGAQRLQGQQAQLEALDPLGAVGRSNSRPGGLSSQSSWETMFPTRPTGQGFAGEQMQHPPTMSNAQGAMGASPAPYMPNPNAFVMQQPAFSANGPNGQALPGLLPPLPPQGQMPMQRPGRPYRPPQAF